ncbi:MAG: putative nucleotidyltransferase substrate binding domain-containing protein [Vicinamibacterales bacterium]
MAESDLLELAARGRVKFHEPNEYILWQGEPHRHQVFVIQQGTVSLWDESAPEAQLRDVRGAGDLLGFERFNGAPVSPHSARSSSDVLIYAFPASDFEMLLMKYPEAGQFVAGYESVVADYEWADTRRDPQRAFLPDVIALAVPATCELDAAVTDIASRLLTGADAVAVLEPGVGLRALLTSDSMLAWLAAGGSTPGAVARDLVPGLPPPLALSPDATVTDAVLAMAGANANALAITSDGTPRGTLQAVVTSRDLSPVFGDQPVEILRDIEKSASPEGLRSLTQRARAFALQQLVTSSSVEWVAHFLQLTDAALIRRVIGWAGGGLEGACWCLCGAAGRAERLTRAAPRLVLVLPDDGDGARGAAAYEEVTQLIGQCGFLERTDNAFARSFFSATRAEWHSRYDRWIADPVVAETYRARPFFDLRPIHGDRALWQSLADLVAGRVGRDFVRLLANDCLASSPPLTFFRDAVVDEFGRESPVFRLEQTALLPLVDVGRVFGLAAKRAFGTSTLERFALATRALPEHQFVFREAAETLRIVLWLQGRVGIAQGTSGAELPPALVSRHDRHLLKSGFRSIHQLLEFTAESAWLEAL